MNLLDIIRKDREIRTNDELEYFKKLYFSDNTPECKKFCKTYDELNEIIDDLQFVSKSRLGKVGFCGKQFVYTYIFRPQIVSDMRSAILGKNVHKIIENVYKILEIKDLLIFHKNITNYIYEKLISLVPKNKIDLYGLKLKLMQFSKYENNRFQNIKNNVGINNETIKKYFFPYMSEIYFYNKTLWIRGLPDALFLQPDGSILVIDYKNGKSKNLLDFWGWKNITKELLFYKILLEHKDTFREDGIKFEPLKISYIQMLFLEDINNSIAINTKMLNEEEFEVLNDINEYFKKLSVNGFDIRYFKNKQTCVDYCPYFNDFCYTSNKYYDKIIDLDTKILNRVKNNIN